MPVKNRRLREPTQWVRRTSEVILSTQWRYLCFSCETWGVRRNAALWTDAATTLTSNNTIRGYTGHEELDTVQLIHMNGRVYDPKLGRFTSPDPIVQFADNPQSYNRYSYALNNPLSYTDPSGFGLFGFLKKIFHAIVNIVKNPQQLASLALLAIPGGQWAAITGFSGTAGVFTQGFAAGLIASNGDLQDSFISGVTAVGFNQVGDYFQGHNINTDVAR